jgi:EAL domain-containing protein (putative c-di-GMP-specific phosphodiesterase class I)
MVKKKEDLKESRPASTPEGREQQLISLAVNLAEKQLRDGSASPSVINHYLKMASRRESLEREILERQSKLIEAKAESIVKAKEQEHLAKAAIEAMKSYNSGSN